MYLGLKNSREIYLLKQVIQKREVILETKILNLCKQCILWYFCRVKNIQSKFVKKVVRKIGDHTKESELPDVEKCFMPDRNIYWGTGYREVVSEDY
jgi:hypothetical protein